MGTTSSERTTRTYFPLWTLALVTAILLAGAWLSAVATQPAAVKAAGLKIVIIAGEDAINVIQQKTAVAPIVEVRDRNDQPVAGAIVSFAIRGGRATFGGARTLTVTTNLAGRAAASGLAPTAKGVVQISASAAFQGETAAVTIAQTNVLTAAQAAAVGGGAGGSGGGSAGAGVAGGGGGLPLTAISIVGAAVAGGALVATRVLGSGGNTTYSGPFRLEAVQLNHQTQGNGIVNLTCTATIAYIGTLTAEIEELADGTVRGNILNQSNATELSRTCPFSSASSGGPQLRSDVTGTTGNLQSSVQFTSSDGVGISAQSFSGVLSGDTIAGTFTHSYSFRTIPTANGFFSDGTFPATSAAVTLQRQ